MKALLATVAATAVLLGTACTTAAGPPAQAGTVSADVRTAVGEAVSAAKAYGQQHLGHYLGLDRAALRTAGVRPAPGVTVTLWIDHFDVCISGTTAAGEASYTATTAAPTPVEGGRCSSGKALRSFAMGAGNQASRTSALRP